MGRARHQGQGLRVDLDEALPHPQVRVWMLRIKETRDPAIECALELSGDHGAHGPCPMEEYVQRRAEARTARIVPVRGA